MGNPWGGAVHGGGVWDIAKSEPWMASGLCREVDSGDMFFPEKGGATGDAKKVCGGCDVRTQCLDYALANDERFGVWGGVSERERRGMRTEDRRANGVRCRICGCAFTATTAQSIDCSDRCRLESRRRREARRRTQ